MPDRPESMVEQVLVHLREGRFTGLLRVRTAQAEGEIWVLSGIRDEVRFGISTGDEAIERLARATDPRFEAIPRLPGLTGGFKKSLPATGALSEVRPVDLLRYCETHALTCVLELRSEGKLARVTYQTGELVSIDGKKEGGDALSEMLESTDGSYEIRLPPFQLPRGVPLTVPESMGVQEPAVPADETRRKAEAEAQDRARRKAEADAEARRSAEAEARRKSEAEAEARRRAEAEARRKSEAEAEARRKAEVQAEARRKAEAAEAEVRRKAEAEAEARRKAEAEAEAEARRKVELEAAEAEARRKAEADEAEARRKTEADAAEARRKAEAESAEAEARRKVEARALEARRGAETQAPPQTEERALKSARSDSERPPRKSESKKKRAGGSGRESRPRSERPKGRKARARSERPEASEPPPAAKAKSGAVWIVLILLLAVGAFAAWRSGMIPR
jgi:hypothetical protein